MQHLESLGRKIASRNARASSVAARPIEALDQATSHRIDADDEHDWDRWRCSFGYTRRNAVGDDHVHLAAHQIGRQFGQPINVTSGPAPFDRNRLPLDVTGPLQAVAKCCNEMLGTLERCATKKSDHRHRRLLRARRERPRRRAAEQRDEVASSHSITSSARASSVGEISRPRARAVLRLITNSNLVDCWTGRSDGFAPLRILSTKLAERYHASLRLA